MANDTVPSDRVPCSFKNCEQVFDSEKEMKYHKLQDETHNYCARCNVDCGSAAELFIHQITSSKHIICPVCSVEFRSTGGRDVHIQINHNRVQTITCTGCGANYKSAAAMIWHIEHNECEGISYARLTQEQARRSMINASLHANKFNIPDAPLPPIVEHYARGGDQDDCQEGGVRLDMEVGATQSSDAPAAPPNPTKSSSVATNAEFLSPADWPVLVPTVANLQNLVIREKSSESLPPTPSTASTAASLPIGPDDLISFDEVPVTQESKASTTGSTFNRRLVRDNTFGIGSMKPNNLIRQTNAQWDPKKFFNTSLGRYVCNCGNSFRRVDDFEMHIVTEREMEERDECPKCHKRFKSTSALVAHMEASRSRCGFRAYREFAHALDEATGGFIQVEGYDEAGNQRLAARVLDEPEASITIGTDLSKPMKQLKM